MSDDQFKIQINFTKAYKADDANVAYIEGIASGPEVDLTGERMALSVLQSMVESFKKGIVEFRDAHKQEWNDDLGELVELSLTEDNHLFYKARIDLNLSGARDLLYRINTLGKEYGVSVGGRIIKAGKEYVADLGREIYTYFEVALEEISFTRNAAYQHSFADYVTKSLTQKGESMKIMQTIDKTGVHKTDAPEEVTPVVEPVVETPADPVAPVEPAEVTPDEPKQEETPAEVVEPNKEEAAPEVKTEVTPESTEKSVVTDDTHKLAKAAVLGNYAEADLAEGAVNDLSWNLQYLIWGTMQDADKTPDERISFIDAALAEFHQLILTVVTALVPKTDVVATTAKAFKETTPDALAKSLTDKDAKVDELTKAMTAKAEELETAQKSLVETNAAKEQLEKDLGAALDTLHLQDSRKVLAFNEGARKAITVDSKSSTTPTNQLPKKLHGVF